MTLASQDFMAFNLSAPGSGNDFKFEGGNPTNGTFASSIRFKTFDNAIKCIDRLMK